MMAGIAPENAGNGCSEPLRRICAIVEGRDKDIRETDIRIEYYRNSLEKVSNEIKYLEKERKKIASKNEFIQKQNDQLEVIKTRLEGSQEVAIQSLINHQYFEQILAQELETKEQEKQCVEQESRNLYCEAQEELNKNPLYKELEDQKVEFLKLDIKRREMEVKIRERKEVIAQKKYIKKKLFYNFFIEMAEEYVIKQRLMELDKLRTEETEAVRRLFAVQEKVKMKQKLGIPKNEFKMRTNIIFGSPECRIENSQSKVDPPQQRRETKLFNEKLNNLFQQDESKSIVASPKVQILSQKVIVPTFVAPNFTPSEKRKYKTVDLSRKWQKLMKNSSFSKEATVGRYSQESQRLSQSSQQSLSPSEQLAIDTVVNEHDESTDKDDNLNLNESIMQSQEIQKILVQQKEVVPPMQYQVENINVGPGRLRFESPQIKVATPYYESSKNQLFLENNDTGKIRMEPEEKQLISIQMKEKVPLVQFHAVENLKVGTPQLKEDTKVLPSPVIQKQPEPAKPLPVAHNSNTRPNISVSQNETAPRSSLSERGKAVRFNLQQPDHQTDSKSILGGQSIFGHMFSPFANRGPIQNEALLQDQTTGVSNNDTINMSFPPVENSRTGLELEYGENDTQIRSPEYSYEMEGGVPQPFNAPERSSFGGGGFFSFGKNMFNPF